MSFAGINLMVILEGLAGNALSDFNGLVLFEEYFG
jgi:hypothetical protein